MKPKNGYNYYLDDGYKAVNLKMTDLPLPFDQRPPRQTPNVVANDLRDARFVCLNSLILITNSITNLLKQDAAQDSIALINSKMELLRESFIESISDDLLEGAVQAINEVLVSGQNFPENANIVFSCAYNTQVWFLRQMSSYENWPKNLRTLQVPTELPEHLKVGVATFHKFPPEGLTLSSELLPENPIYIRNGKRTTWIENLEALQTALASKDTHPRIAVANPKPPTLPGQPSL